MVEVLALVADPLTQNVFVLTSYYPQNMRQFLVSAINVLVFISSINTWFEYQKIYLSHIILMLTVGAKMWGKLRNEHDVLARHIYW